jgi:hypothetical protein
MKVNIMNKDGFKVVDLNRRKAIHEKCLNCSCWSSSEVTGCKFSDCLLWQYRTGRVKQNPKKRQQAVRSYCIWCMNGQTGEVSKCPSKNCPLFHFRGKGKEKAKNAALNPGFVHLEGVFKTDIGQGIPEAIKKEIGKEIPFHA